MHQINIYAWQFQHFAVYLLWEIGANDDLNKNK